jgi:hypothetical protein
VKYLACNSIALLARGTFDALKGIENCPKVRACRPVMADFPLLFPVPILLTSNEELLFVETSQDN